MSLSGDRILMRIRPLLATTLVGIASLYLCLSPAQNALAQRDLRDIPKPDPAAELAAMQIGEGFEVSLYASDPAFAKPIHMNFDEQGRLWIASSRNYPQIEPGAKPTDQIVVLEDRDRDGIAEHSTVFADDLLIPTGVLAGDGGVYVANSTQLIHLVDTDGDGKADRRRTILSGFGTEDTHHLLHTLRWGPDGRMYFNQSIYIHSHVETPHGVKRLDGGGIWRFDPATSELEILCKGFVNSWGHVIDAFGQSLATDGAYGEGINYVFPESVYFSSPGAVRWLSGLNPGSPKHCSLEMISGDAMPESLQGRLVTNDFRSHRVCLFEIDRAGAGYRSVQLPEIIRTEHVAFRPIDAKMGPDGALYIADWYNPIIQHGEVDFRDPRRDTEHGRIWRVSAKGKKPLMLPKYESTSEEGLCKLTRDSALWVRQFARMELARRQRSKRDAALVRFVESASEPAEKSLRRLEQLFVKSCARELDPLLIDQLRNDSDARLRAIAIRFAGRYRERIPEAMDWVKEAIKDADDQVVLEGVTALGQVQSMEAVTELLSVASRPNQDQFLRFALWNAMRLAEPIWQPALESGKLSAGDDLAKLRLLADAATQPAVARPLLEMVRSGKISASAQPQLIELVAEKANAELLGNLLEWLIASRDAVRAPDSDSADSGLNILARVTQSRNVRPGRCDAILKGALDRELADGKSVPSTNEAFLARLVELAGQWQCVTCAPAIIQWLSGPTAPSDAGRMRTGLIALAKCQDPKAGQYVRSRARDQQMPPTLRAAALSALSVLDVNEAALQTLPFLASIDASNLAAGESAAASLVSRGGGTESIRKALSTMKDVTWNADGARALMSVVRNAPGSNDALLAEIAQATRLEALGWRWSDQWARRILDQAATSGDASRGEVVYRQARLQCVRCHSIGQSGGAIGPNLVSMGGSSTPEYVLQSLIDPNAKQKEGFQTLTVLTDDGRVFSGLQKSRSEKQLQLITADGTVQTLATDSIDSISNGRSIMPAGLVDVLKEQELVDLTRFLMELGRSPAFTVDMAPRVRNWSILNWTTQANVLLNRTSLDSAASDAPQLVWSRLPSTVAGRILRDELPVFQPHRDGPAVAFASFDIECKQPGSIMMEFTAPVHSVSLWLDGRPRPTPSSTEPIHLAAGLHRCVLALKIKELASSFGCQVQSEHAGAAIIELKVRP